MTGGLTACALDTLRRPISSPSHNCPTQCDYPNPLESFQEHKPKMSFFFLFLCGDFPCFSSTNIPDYQESLTSPSTTLFSPHSAAFIFKRDILTLTGGRRGGTFVTLLLSPVIFSCRESQMVRFSAHMVVFLGDRHSWPAWHKKEKVNMTRC